MKNLGYNAHVSHVSEFSWGSKPGPQFMKRMAQALRVSNLDMLNCFEVEGTPTDPVRLMAGPVRVTLPALKWSVKGSAV
jgi:hypothetical protein